MSEILPRHLWIGVILFTLLVSGGVSMMSSFKSADSTFGDDAYGRATEANQSFNKIVDVENKTKSIQSNLATLKTSPGVLGWLDALVSTAWNGLSGMFSSLQFLTDLITDIPKIWPEIPAWIPATFTLLIIVIIGFAIYSAIFQKEV